MDKWMDIKEIEQLILALRKREYNDENNKEVKQNITLALEKIDSLKQECLQKIQYSKSKGIESILYLLKTDCVQNPTYPLCREILLCLHSYSFPHLSFNCAADSRVAVKYVAYVLFFA